MKEYNNFLFFGNWRLMLDAFDEPTAKDILWEIMRYGTEGEIQTDNPIISGIINGTIAENINHSQQKYNKAVNGGRPRKEIDIQRVMRMIEEGKTYQDIADIMGVSKNTIGERVREYRNQEQTKNQTKNHPLTQEVEVKEEEKEKGKEDVKTSNDLIDWENRMGF